MSLFVLPAPSGVRPRHFTFLTAAMAVLAVLYVLNLSARWSGYLPDDRSWIASGSQRLVTVGDIRFAVPADMLRVPVQGLFSLPGANVLATLRLAVTWPTMGGFRDAAGELAAFGNGSSLILLDISLDTGEESLRSQLDPVYRRLARGAERDGPAGLRILSLSAPGDEIDEIIFENGSAADGFLARCRRPAGKVATVCQSQKPLPGGLTVTYRFEQPLLANWGRLERRVSELVNALILDPRS